MRVLSCTCRQVRELESMHWDQTGDNDFYKSSLNLNKTWIETGMRAEISISDGGHCQTHSFEWIANCLDDGTGRLGCSAVIIWCPILAVRCHGRTPTNTKFFKILLHIAQYY